MTITANTKAEGTEVSVLNVIAQQSTDVKERKPLIIATYDEDTYTTISENEPIYEYSNSEQVGADSGFGYPAEFLARMFHQQCPDMPFTVMYIPQNVGTVFATGSYSITGTVTQTKELPFYVAGKRVSVTAIKDETGTEVNAKLVAAINTEVNLVIEATVNGGTDTQGDCTAKFDGLAGNFISMAFALGLNEEIPPGLTCTVTAMSGGATNPSVANALLGLGQADTQNANDYTAIVDSLGLDETALDAYSEYNGLGNEEIGNYSGAVARPFNRFIGDITSGATVPSALTTQTANNRYDRTNCIVPVPNSYTHPFEIAAKAMAESEKKARIRPEETVENRVLIDVWPSTGAQWTNDNVQRDIAVKSGLSTTKNVSGSVVIGDLITLYRPLEVPVKNNGYREVRNCKITQNILNSKKVWYSGEMWTGITIVEKANTVSDFNSSQKVRDLNMILTSVIELVHEWQRKAWIFSADYTISKIMSNVPSYVALREDGLGFNVRIPVIYAAMGKTRKISTEFDVALTVFTNN